MIAIWLDMGWMSRTGALVRAMVLALSLAIGFAGVAPLASGHAHASLDGASHAVDVDRPDEVPRAPAEHGRRHANGGCHAVSCGSLLAQPVVLVVPGARPLRQQVGPATRLPSGPDLPGDPPVPKDG